jgi:Ran GTPase-activating protein (RanGAP) involved in mRNA processing and transport
MPQVNNVEEFVRAVDKKARIIEMKYAHDIDSEDVKNMCAAIASSRWLRDVKLTHMDFDDKQICAIAKAVASNPSIRGLDLSNNEPSLPACQGLGQMILDTSSLSRLNLAGGVGEKECLEILRALAKNRSVVDLDLTAWSISPEACLGIREVLNNGLLTRLIMRCGGIGYHGGCREIASALTTNHTLLVLDLEENSLGDEGCRILCEALESNNCLRTLILSRNDLCPESGEAIGKLLMKHPALEHLDLSHNSLMGEGTAPIFEGLGRDTCKLKHLNLASNDIGVFDNSIGGVIRHNNSLRTIILTRNGFNSEDACAIADGLRVNTTLKCLDISTNYFEDEGVKAFAQALMTNTTLTKLDVSCTEMSDAGCHELVKVLECNRTLTSLGVACNALTDASGAALARALASNPTLESLDVSDNRFAEGFATAFSRALNTNRNLQQVNLSSNLNSGGDIVENHRGERISSPMPDRGVLEIIKAFEKGAGHHDLMVKGIPIWKHAAVMGLPKDMKNWTEQQMWSYCRRQRSQDKIAAFVMGQHERLGADSPVRALRDDILRAVFDVLVGKSLLDQGLD